MRLEDGAADGLMPLNTLPDDFYDYDEQAQMLKGQRNGWQFSVGMHVRVKVTEVTPVTGGILVEWTEGGLRSKHSRQKGKNHAKKSFEKTAAVARGRGTSKREPRSAKGTGGKRKRR